MRWLMVLAATLGVLGLLVYRQRSIDRWERTLAIGAGSAGAVRR